MINQPKLNGWKREAPNKQHKIFTGATAKLTVSSSDVIDMRNWCSAVEDQRELGSCVANATVGALELLRIKNGQPDIQLSRLFTYYNTRLMHGDQARDVGSIISLAIGTLNTIGTCTEANWPYNTNQVFVRPSWASYQQAYGNKIGNFELISGHGKPRIELIVNALRGGYPVVFGCEVDDAFTANKSQSLFFTGNPMGNHAMLIVGYKPQSKEFIVKNSWGTSFGDQGYWYMHENILDQQNAGDVWVLYESVQLLKKS